jgi:hypothetical protein
LHAFVLNKKKSHSYSMRTSTFTQSPLVRFWSINNVRDDLWCVRTCSDGRHVACRRSIYPLLVPGIVQASSWESYPPSFFHFPLRHPVPAGRPPQDYHTLTTMLSCISLIFFLSRRKDTCKVYYACTLAAGKVVADFRLAGWLCACTT